VSDGPTDLDEKLGELRGRLARAEQLAALLEALTTHVRACPAIDEAERYRLIGEHRPTGEAREEYTTPDAIAQQQRDLCSQALRGGRQLAHVATGGWPQTVLDGSPQAMQQLDVIQALAAELKSVLFLVNLGRPDLVAERVIGAMEAELHELGATDLAVVTRQ
jgi:hypothetical protein